MKFYLKTLIFVLAILVFPNVIFAAEPVVDISATKNSILSGESTKISWFALDTDFCDVTKNGSSWQAGTYGMNIDSDTLTSNTTFVVTCTGPEGSVSQSVNITVSGESTVNQDNTVDSTSISTETVTPVPTPAPVIVSFSRDLSIGMTGSDVKALQKYLNTKGYLVSDTGAGSPGYEGTYFGKSTQDALIEFQKRINIIPPAGYFGPVTRSYVKSHPLK